MKKISQLQMTTIHILMVTLGVRGLSLLRDSLMANQLGLNQGADNFFLIIDWANFATTLIGTTTVNLLVPRIRNYTTQGRSSAVLINFYSSKFYWLISITFLLLINGFLWTTNFSIPLAILCGCIFITQSLCGYYSSLINIKKIFILPSLLYGLPIFGTLIYFLFPKINPSYLLLFFLMGSIIQTLFLHFLVSRGFDATLRLKVLSLRKLMSGIKNWTWIALATLYFPASNFLNIQLSALLEVGSISLISYSSRIPFAISNILIFSFWTVALPTTDIKKNRAFLNYQIYTRLLKILSLATSLAIFGYAASPIIVDILFNHNGNLSADELSQIIIYQKWYFIILPAQIVTSLLLRYLHIMGEAKATLVAGLFGMAAQVLLFTAMDKALWTIPMGFITNFGSVFLILFIFTLFKIYQQKKLSFVN